MTYRIQEIASGTFELDRLNETGVWQLIGYFDSQAAAQNKMADRIAADGFSPPEPLYFDGLGQAVQNA